MTQNNPNPNSKKFPLTPLPRHLFFQVKIGDTQLGYSYNFNTGDGNVSLGTNGRDFAGAISFDTTRKTLDLDLSWHTRTDTNMIDGAFESKFGINYLIDTNTGRSDINLYGNADIVGKESSSLGSVKGFGQNLNDIHANTSFGLGFKFNLNTEKVSPYGKVGLRGRYKLNSKDNNIKALQQTIEF